jgi:general L-amino acid transport system substrate-binding protein
MKHIIWKSAACALAALGAFAASNSAYAGKTLENIKSRGQLVCGVNTGLIGFSQADAAGNWTGLDADICKAIAAAVLGDPNKVKWVPLNASQRFTALQSGDVDILSRNTTWTLTRDASFDMLFVGITYFDGQGFMVPKKSPIRDGRQLRNQTVCVQSGTTTVKNLLDFSKANNLNIKPVIYEKLDAVNDAYFSGRCAAYTTDASSLASLRVKEAKNPDDHVILPLLISKEPFGLAVRRGDDEWFSIARWVLYGLLEAEEYGVTQANVEQMKTSPDPVVQRMLGTTEDTGKLLGLDKDWMARAIKATGNYGEIFENNVGPRSALKLPRGANGLWNKGGLMYAPPIR